MTWKFDWTRDWDTILSEDHVRRWRADSAAEDAVTASPFFHPDVVCAWLESMGGRNRIQPFFLTARSDSNGHAFLPLARLNVGWKQGGIRRLRPVGDRLFDYHDPIIIGTGQQFPEELWAELFHELRRFRGDWFDEFELPRIRHPSAPDAPGWDLSDKAPFVRLDAYASFDAYLASRPKSLRGDVRRQIRRLAEIGEVRYQVHGPEDLDAVLDWIPLLEREREARYPGSRLPSGYLARLAGTMSPDSPVHCSSITLDGKPVSWHIGFCWQGVMYWYVPIYDPDFATWSPGKIHLYFALEEAFANGVRTFDFLRGMETYKAGWTDAEEFRMYATSLRAEGPASQLRRTMAAGLNQAGYARAWLRQRR